MPGSNIRVGSAERESALEALSTHLTAERLDIVEYQQRTAAVTAARTRADLLEVFEDLPAPHPRWDTHLEPEPKTEPERSRLLDNSPARLSRPIVLVLAGTMVAAAVLVAAITATWWALLPALLIIIVMFLTN